MAYFLLILGFSTIVARPTYGQEDTVEQLKLILSTELTVHQEKFILSFQGINPAQILYPDNSNQRYMTFSSKYDTIINETAVRYTQFASIVIAYLSADQYHTEEAFSAFCLRPSTTFILLIDCLYAGQPCRDPILPPLYICPALKIFVFPRNYTKTSDIIAAVSAAGYSQYRFNLFSVLVKAGLLASPLNIHKLKFWIGNLKHIPVAVHFNHPEYLQKYSNNTYICSEMVMNHKFSDKYMCLFDIMTTIYLAQVHNLSLNMIDGKGLFIIQNQFTEVIGPSQNYIDSHLLFPFKQTGVALSCRQSSKIIYCPKTTLDSKPRFDFSVWIEPFPVNVWVLFIISFILLPYKIFADGFGNKFEGIFALLSWQSVSPRNGKVVIILSFSAMFVNISYSNEITSLMVVLME